MKEKLQELIDTYRELCLRAQPTMSDVLDDFEALIQNFTPDNYIIVEDNEGDPYLIPENKVEEWYEYLDEEPEDSPEWADWAKRPCVIHTYSYTDR